MSFRNPFKAHGPKKTAISRTEEREFEREVKKLEQLDENTRKLYKDMKNCNDSQTSMSKCHIKLAQDFANSALCTNETELQLGGEQWTTGALKMEALSQELNANCSKTVIDPMKKFGCIFPSAQASIKKRDQSLQEYSKYQTKVGKYLDRERTGSNVVKLDLHKKSRATTKDDYEFHNSVLMTDMPRLYEGRIDYFQPCFQALIRSQVKYYSDAHNVYTELSQQMAPRDTTSQDDTNEDEFSRRISQNIDQIRALAITVDD